MGWTWLHVDKDQHGKIDRKKVMDEQFSTGGDSSLEVVKSRMVGVIWYAAVKWMDKITFESVTYGVAAVTSLNNQEYCNFGYKDTKETEGIYYHDCPVTILELLDEPEDQKGLYWRNACYANHKKRSKQRQI